MTTPELVARMLNTLLEGLGLAALVWLGLRFSKPLNSGTRFAVWFFTLIAIVALPFIGFGSVNSFSASSVQPKFVLPESLAIYLFVAWGVIASALLLRLAISLAHVWRLRSEASELKVGELDPIVCDIFAESSRQVRVLVSGRMRVPAAIGFLRPAIIVPTWALRDLPTDELRSILLHELAHLRRWDDWTNLAQKVLKALFFFHPAVWWIESRLSLEREMACDDRVLAETSSPRAYATSLLSLAERVGLSRTIALAQAALGRARHTSVRIAQILDSKRPKGTRIWKPALGFGVAITAVAFVAVPYAPDLVAFASPEPLAVASALPRAPEIVMPATKQASDVEGSVRPDVRTRVKAKVPVAVPAAEKPHQVSQAQMVLVMQSTQFDETGAPVFMLTVWQITDKDREQVRTEIVMRSL